MIRCGRNGATLLYGTKCVGCDCQLAGLADGGTIPRGTEAPDLVDAMAHLFGSNPYARRQERRGFDDLDDRLMREGFYPSGGVYERVRRERAAVEIITDPNDRRGFDARPVRAA